MIDIDKEYVTRGGLRVTSLRYVPYNSAGRKVTYPIKGSIVVREKPFKTQYAIWSEEGISDVVWGRFNERDLIPL